jgi:hypothetical protein
MLKRLIILFAVCLLLFACDKSTEPVYQISDLQFNPEGGIYSSPQSVRIDCDVDGVSIRYTLDGTEPTPTSALYGSPIPISSSVTLRARAYKSKMKPSEIAEASYSFSVSALFITPPTNTIPFNTPQTVNITYLTEGTVIHYTTDGSEPTVESATYTGPFVVDGNMTVKAKGFIEGWLPSETRTANYTFAVSLPTFDHNAGTYGYSFDLSMSTPTTGAEIRYTTDGTEPTETSNLYSVPINIGNTTTIKAKAYKANWNSSAIITAAYILKVAQPSFSPAAGTYFVPQNITVSTTTSDAVIYYTLDGSTPTTASDIYISPIPIAIGTVLKAFAVREGWTNSDVRTGSYNFTVSTPTFDPLPGSFAGPQTITLACVTPDAEIHYTLNNTDPDVSDPLYTDPILLNSTTTIRARAFKVGYNQSAMAVGNFLITNQCATPTFDPEPGIFFDPVQINLYCTTDGVEIRYTLNGTEPTVSSTLFYYPIELEMDATIKAKAFKLGWVSSQTATGLYQFDSVNQIVAWGINDNNQTNVPLGTDFAQIDAGLYHSVGLRTDGSLVAWGRNNNQQCNFPAGNDYVAVSAGDNHSMALKADGTVVCWGLNDGGQCDVPDSLNYEYVAISAGGNHSVALTSDNKIIAWGNNDDGQCDAPVDTTFVKVSAGANHNIALKANGSIVAWGNNDNGQINAPTGTGYIDVAAGDQHSIAQRTNGTLLAWGLNADGQTDVPSGNNYVKLSGGYRHNLALRNDGSIVTWGYSGNNLGNVPTLGTYIDLSAGGDFSIALKTPPGGRKKVFFNAPKARIRIKK